MSFNFWSTDNSFWLISVLSWVSLSISWFCNAIFSSASSSSSSISSLSFFTPASPASASANFFLYVAKSLSSSLFLFRSISSSRLAFLSISFLIVASSVLIFFITTLCSTSRWSLFLLVASYRELSLFNSSVSPVACSWSCLFSLSTSSTRVLLHFNSALRSSWSLVRKRSCCRNCSIVDSLSAPSRL